MSRFVAEIREAYIHLKRAEEIGQFFQHSPEQMELLDKVRRGAAKVIQLSSEKRNETTS